MRTSCCRFRHADDRHENIETCLSSLRRAPAHSRARICADPRQQHCENTWLQLMRGRGLSYLSLLSAGCSRPWPLLNMPRRSVHPTSNHDGAPGFHPGRGAFVESWGAREGVNQELCKSARRVNNKKAPTRWRGTGCCGPCRRRAPLAEFMAIGLKNMHRLATAFHQLGWLCGPLWTCFLYCGVIA